LRQLFLISGSKREIVNRQLKYAPEHAERKTKTADVFP
jgi:hypothetical protein